jgi:hypothetical protein
MKRFRLLFTLAGLLVLPTLAEEAVAGPRQLRPNVRAAQQQQIDAQQRPNAQQQIQNQIRVTISDYYKKKFQEAVELSDEQTIKMSFFIQSFIDMRFNAAMRRDAINQRLEQLQAQPNPSESDVEELILQKTLVDNNFGNMENQFLNKIRPDLKPGQAVRVLTFNRKFFDEDLPGLIEQVRSTTQQRLQEPQVRQNQNNQNQRQNNPNRPGNALRQNKQGQN